MKQTTTLAVWWKKSVGRWSYLHKTVDGVRTLCGEPIPITDPSTNLADGIAKTPGVCQQCIDKQRAFQP